MGVVSYTPEIMYIFLILDENKERLLSHNEGDVLLRLIALAANADNSEIQYNCAGTIGQLTLTGAVYFPNPSICHSLPHDIGKISWSERIAFTGLYGLL